MVRRDHFHTEGRELGVTLVALVGLVANEPGWKRSDEARLQRVENLWCFPYPTKGGREPETGSADPAESE